MAFAGIEDGVRDTLRLAGWAGPSRPSRSRASRSRSSLRPMTQKAAATPTTAPDAGHGRPTAVSAIAPAGRGSEGDPDDDERQGGDEPRT